MVSWAHRWWVDLDFLAIGGVWRWWLDGGFSWSIVVFSWVLMFGVWLVGSGRDVLVFWLRCVLVFLWLLGFGLIWRLPCVLHVWLLRKCKKRKQKNIDFYNFLGNELFEEEHEPLWESEEEREQFWGSGEEHKEHNKGMISEEEHEQLWEEHKEHNKCMIFQQNNKKKK